MVGCRRLEPLSSMSSGEGCQQVQQTLCVRSALASFVRFEPTLLRGSRGSCGPPRFWFRRGRDTSFQRRSHVHTFDCRIHGSYTEKTNQDLTNAKVNVTYYF